MKYKPKLSNVKNVKNVNHINNGSGDNSSHATVTAIDSNALIDAVLHSNNNNNDNNEEVDVDDAEERKKSDWQRRYFERGLRRKSRRIALQSDHGNGNGDGCDSNSMIAVKCQRAGPLYIFVGLNVHSLSHSLHTRSLSHSHIHAQ